MQSLNLIRSFCLIQKSGSMKKGVPILKEVTKEKVINYYKGKDFLEATLSLLAGYRPEEQ